MERDLIADARQLWEECFGDTKEYMDYYFQEKMKDNQIFTLYDRQILTSMVHLNPYQLVFRGKRIMAHYIVGVATRKNFRKQGRMKMLLEESFGWMEKEGELFTYLMPADEKIYRPFGFEYIYTQRRIHLGQIGKKQWNIVTSWEVRSMGMLDVNQLEEMSLYVNQILDQNFTLYTFRSVPYYQRLWKEMMAAGGDVLVFYKEGNLTGVVAYMLESGQCQVVESITKPENTTEVINGLFSVMIKEEPIEVTFLESYFLSEKDIVELFPELNVEEKPIIMAKLLGDVDISQEEFFAKEKVYINEIV